MSIIDVATTELVSIDKNRSLKDAALKMLDNHVGCLVVTETVDGRENPCGLITDRDIALSLVNAERERDCFISEVMCEAPMVARESEGIFEVSAKMKRFGVRRVPVVGMSGEWKGIVSIDDLLILISEELKNLAGIYETQSKNETQLSQNYKGKQIEFVQNKVLTSANRANFKY